MITTSLIKQIILENRQEVMAHRVLPRNITLEGFERQIILGVEGAGKSYLLYGKMQRLIRNEGLTWDDMLYINFEDERLIGMEAEDLNKILEAFGILSPKRPILFLEEIQNIDGWSKFARRLADNKYHMYITVSNAKMLSSEIEGQLGARFITKLVYPYAYDEFLLSNGVKPNSNEFQTTTATRSEEYFLFKQYFHFGGFIGVALQRSKRDYLLSLYQKIFLGNLVVRHKIENVLALRMLYHKLAENVGEPLSFNRIAKIIKDTGTKTSVDSVIRYIEYARQANLLYAIPNLAETLEDKNGNLKYYFVDHGIITLLESSQSRGVFENLVAMALIRKFGFKDQLFYYCKNGIEVDFYIPECQLAIQACYEYKRSDSTREREINALIKLNQRFPGNRNIIVTLNTEETIESDGVTIEVLPLNRFLLNKY